MKDKIITIYCLCDEMLKALGQRDDLQCSMNTAEVMTTALVAALFFKAIRRQVVYSSRAMVTSHKCSAKAASIDAFIAFHLSDGNPYSPLWPTRSKLLTHTNAMS